MAAVGFRRSFGKGHFCVFAGSRASRRVPLPSIIHNSRKKSRANRLRGGISHKNAFRLAGSETTAAGGRMINFGKTAFIAVFRANRKFSSVNLGQTPVCSSGRGRKTQASAYSSEKRLCRFSGKQEVIERSCGTYACLLATGEKQINNFFRLYVENRPALHGLHFSFVAGRSFPSSVSSADSFPSRGKPFFIPV